MILAHRYAIAVTSGSVGEALRAGVKLVATMKLAANVPPSAEDRHRVVLEAFEFANPLELLADTSLVDAIQSLILDALTAHAPGSISQCLLAGCAARRDTRRVRDPSAIGAGTRRRLATLRRGPRCRTYSRACKRNCSRLQHYRSGAVPAFSSGLDGDHARDLLSGRAELEPGAARIITAGWTYVLEHQRFLLKNVSRAAPGIEDAISGADPPSLASTAALLLAARYAVTHRFEEGWLETLKSAAEEKSKL